MGNDKKSKIKKEKPILKTESSPQPSASLPPLSKKAKKKKEPSPEQSKPIPEEVADSPVPKEDEKNGEMIDWPKDDDLELFQRIKNALPKEDTLKFESQVKNTDWDKVAFRDYSGEECKKRWLFVQGHLRRFRTLTELLQDAVEWRGHPWTNFNRGAKSQKHPDQPKKPLTSYMLFYMEMKDKVLQEQPGLGMTDLSRVIAKLYNEMSERKKQKYTEQAKKEKEVYDAKMKKFMEEHPDYVQTKPEKPPVRKISLKVPTPLKLYCDAKVPKLQGEGMSHAEALEACREKFKTLGDKQRIKWIYRALEEEERYKEEFEKHRPEHTENETVLVKSVLSKEEKQLKDRYEGKPEKPPNSGYSLFSKELLSSSNLRHLESKERMTEISRLWKELSDEQRTQYNEKVQELLHIYKLEYASYLESLPPKQREAALKANQRTVKRPARPKEEAASTKPTNTDQPKSKKVKLEEKKSEDESSSEQSDVEEEHDEVEANNEDDFQEDSDSDFEQKTIQKPKSSLQMFCDKNITKYKKKFPKMSQQELNRLMAKEFSNLSEEKKRIYTNMAKKAQQSETAIKPNGKNIQKSPTSPAKTNKNPKEITPKIVVKVSKSPGETASKSTLKPSTKANLKSTTAPVSKANTKTLPESIYKSSWETSQHLYQNEPPKPPETAASMYCHMTFKEATNFTQNSIDEHWEKLPDKQKKKYIDMHKKKQKEYVSEFENFVRNLPTEELKNFRAFMKKREKQASQDSSDDDSSMDDSSDEESSNDSD